MLQMLSDNATIFWHITREAEYKDKTMGQEAPGSILNFLLDTPPPRGSSFKYTRNGALVTMTTDFQQVSLWHRAHWYQARVEFTLNSAQEERRTEILPLR